MLPVTIAALLLSWMLAAPAMAADAGAIFSDDFAEAQPGSRPPGWGLSGFHGSSVPALTVLEGAGADKAIRLEWKDKEARLFSLHHRLGRLDLRRPHEVSLRYRAPVRDIALHADLSAGPGCSIPWVRHRATLPRTDTWREVTLRFDDISSLRPEGSFIELIFEGGGYQAGDALELDRVALRSLAVPAVRFTLASPGSRTLFTQARRQDVVIRVSCGDEVTQPTPVKSTLFDGDGRHLRASSEDVQGDGEIRYDLRPLPAGSYRIVVESEAFKVREEYPIVKRAGAARGARVHDGVLTVDGEPFLMQGLYHVSQRVLDITTGENAALGMPAPRLEDALRGVRERGFNCFTNGWSVPSVEFLAKAEAAGLKVIGEIGKPDAERTAAETARVRNAASLIGYHIMDEPTAGALPAAVETFHNLKRLDPDRFVISAIDNAGIGLGSQAFLDIVSPDPYPISSATSPLGSVYTATRSCDREMVRGDPARMLVLTVQLFTTDGRWGAFPPTPAQVRAMTYLGLVAGAKGFLYYAYYTHEALQAGMPGNPGRKHWYLPESPLWDTMPALNAEIASLKEVILLGRPTDRIAVECPDDVKWRCLEHGGEATLFLANAAPDASGAVRITTEDAGRLRPLFGSAEPGKEGQGYSIALPGYGVGVYRAAPR